MPVLILMRHAKAVREHEAPSDRARGLTPRGRREAALAAQAMRDRGHAPQSVLASNAVRTVETAVIVGGVVAPTAELTYVDDLYLASAETIWSEALPSASSTEKSVLVVGHNPGLHELAIMLIERSGDRSQLARAFLDDMPTSAWTVFEVEGGDLESSTARFVGGWTAPREG